MIRTLRPAPRSLATAVAAGTLAAGLLLTGCSGGADTPSATNTPATGGAGGTSAGATSGTTPSSAPASTVQTVDASKDLRDVKCEHDDDGWSFTGKVTNSGSDSTIYTVTVRIAPKSNTKQTIGLTTITKQIDSKKTVSFATKDFSKLTKKNNTCLASATKRA